MKYIISLFWAFIFSFVTIFIITSILGSNSEVNTLRDCAILSVIFTVFVALLDAIGLDKKSRENYFIKIKFIIKIGMGLVLLSYFF